MLILSTCGRLDSYTCLVLLRRLRDNAMLQGWRELTELESPQTARNIYDVGRQSGFSCEFLYKVYLVTFVDTRFGCGRCIVYVRGFIW